MKQNLEEIFVQFSLTSDGWGDLEVSISKNFYFSLSFFSAAVAEEVIVIKSPNNTVIILILLAVIILALLIVFSITSYDRRRRNKTKGTFCFFVRSILFFILKRLNVTATKLYLFPKNMI